MSAFYKSLPDTFGLRAVEPLHIKPSAILVRPGNAFKPDATLSCDSQEYLQTVTHTTHDFGTESSCQFTYVYGRTLGKSLTREAPHLELKSTDAVSPSPQAPYGTQHKFPKNGGQPNVRANLCLSYANILVSTDR
ncbi:hypothetical protein [Delftia sp. JD2]|uniref:hypothetical protein n=1 Tax=Delftia sp. JD2 TaxID=469553 RepID=UPI0011119863|nr:hypothetical protein [Delftia sp. JD2]